jgi:hypothetical protein
MIFFIGIFYMDLIDFKSKFDWQNYVSKYPDLKGADTLEKAWRHANYFGWKEHRMIFDDVQLQDNFVVFKKTGVITSEPNEINQQLVEEGINMYNLNNLTDEHINKISKNVHGFSDQIKPYNKILFISGDYPGYGGAATNCYELQKYFKTLGHTTFGFYFNYETGTNAKHEIHDDHIIDDVCNLKSIEFKPELIILKSPVNIELKSLFKCPVYYLIGGIYKNELDKYDYEINAKEDNDKYINKDVLNHISKYDKSFVNSQHTADILTKFYGVSTNIFYSSFVPYVDKKVFIDPDFEKRKYNYGLIVSNFDRKIKNVERSIEFLKDKENVILIGQGSERYKSIGFTCIGAVDKEEMDKYYNQIKYIVQDSFYESCSNVRIEGLFNGCNVIKSYNVVIASTQYPGYGGAASVAYDYHKKLLDEGYNSKLFFFLNKKEIELMLPDSNLYNPSSYKNVYYLLSQNFHDKKEQYSDFNVANTIIAFNYGIIPIIKKHFSGELIYYVTGSPELTLGENSPVNNNISYEKFMNESNYKYLLDNKQSILNLMNLELADKVVVSCEIVKNLYIKFYPQFSNKYIIEPFEKNIYEYKHKLPTDTNKILFNDREFFIICATSSWKRPVKNVALIYNIFKHFPDENKVIIGTQNDKYNFKDIPNTTVLDIIPNNELHRFLCNSKNYILPSFFESASITLLEALHNGCNVITSRNVGLSYLIPENNIVDDFENLRSWLKIMCYKKCNLFTSLDYPGFGGAATNMFEIYNYYKSKYNLLSLLLFITDEKEGLKYNDPDNNIFVTSKKDIEITMKLINTKININMGTKHFKINIIYKIYSTIQIVRPYINDYKINKVIYFCSGLKSLQNKTKTHCEGDIEPFNTSDVCVVNSNVTYNYVKKYYNKQINIVNTSIIFKEVYLKQNNKFDFIFNASSYKRIAKNSKLALQIFSHPKMKKFKKIIIGNDFPISKINNIDNLTYMKLTSNDEFISILQQTKMCLIPSIYDSMPNTLYEAICNGVIPYISKSIECDIIPEKYFFDIELDIEHIVNNIIDIYNTATQIDKDVIGQKKGLELYELQNIFNYIN